MNIRSSEDQYMRNMFPLVIGRKDVNDYMA